MPLSLREIEDEIYENSAEDDSVPMFFNGTDDEDLEICNYCGGTAHTEADHGKKQPKHVDETCEACGGSGHTEDDHDRRTDNGTILD